MDSKEEQRIRLYLNASMGVCVILVMACVNLVLFDNKNNSSIEVQVGVVAVFVFFALYWAKKKFLN